MGQTVQLTGSLTLAFDFNNPLNGTAVLCGDLDTSTTSRVDGDGEPEGGGLPGTLPTELSDLIFAVPGLSGSVPSNIGQLT